MKKQYKKLIKMQLVILFLILIIFIFLRSEFVESVPKCFFKEKYGILCPACNGTKFVIELSRFNFTKAFIAHPLFFILAIYLFLLDIIYIINTLFNKNIKIYRFWHLIIWLVFLVIYTILRNTII